MLLIGYLVNQIINIYILIIVITAVLSWMVAFDVVNRQSAIVKKVLSICTILTQPVLAPIRKVIPPFQGLDLSPIVLYLALNTLRFFLNHYLFTL